MKNKRMFFALVLSLVSTSAFAQPPLAGRESGGLGPAGIIFECDGQMKDGAQAHLRVNGTAAAGLYQGYLEFAKGDVNTYCKKTGTPVIPGAPPTAGVNLYSCAELRDGEGKVTIEIARGGFSGLVLAEVSQEQIYPLPAQFLGTLICK